MQMTMQEWEEERNRLLANGHAMGESRILGVLAQIKKDPEIKLNKGNASDEVWGLLKEIQSLFLNTQAGNPNNRSPESPAGERTGSVVNPSVNA
jgi:hypothetical protein